MLGTASGGRENRQPVAKGERQHLVCLMVSILNRLADELEILFQIIWELVETSVKVVEGIVILEDP